MKITMMTSGTINSSLSLRPLSLAKELVKLGHEVSIFAPRFDKYSQFKDEQISEIAGVTIIRPIQITKLPFELGLISYMISSAILLHKVNPDIVHIFKANPITNTGMLLKLTKNTPFILDTDDLDSEVMRIENNSEMKIKLVELSEKAAAKYASAITAASKYLKKHYAAQYKAKTIAYVPNGAEFITMKKINTKKISSNKIVFLGNINRINILEPLLYTIQALKNKKMKLAVTIIGDGQFLPYFKKLAKKLSLNQQIEFLGHKDQASLHQYIKTGDIGYCYMPNEPTIQACSSMKVFQYMQYGAVPLVSNVGDLPLYAFEGEAGYIANNNDQASLTNILLEAITNKQDIAKKIAFAQANASKKYAWSVLAKQVETVYKKII